MKPLFRIALCELFHPFLFGKDENNDKNIDGHFLVINSYTRSHFINNGEDEEDDDEDDDDEEDDEEDEDDEDDEDEEEYEEYEEAIPLYTSNIFEIVEKDITYLNTPGGRKTLPNINHPLINHPLVRNYRHIVRHGLKFEIAHCITLSGGEYVAILKTFWIKIIIRAFKNAFKRKMWKMYSDRLRGIKETKRSLLKGLLHKLS